MVDVGLIVTIVAFESLPDTYFDQVLVMAEVRCLIFSPRPTHFGTCGRVINGVIGFGVCRDEH